LSFNFSRHPPPTWHSGPLERIAARDMACGDLDHRKGPPAGEHPRRFGNFAWRSRFAQEHPGGALGPSAPAKAPDRRASSPRQVLRPSWRAQGEHDVVASLASVSTRYFS